MASDPFARMHKTLFARLGKEGFLRVGESCLVEVREGEAILGEDGGVVAYRTTADIAYGDVSRPRAGETLVVGTDTFKLDFLIKDDGYSAKWVVL